VSASDRHDEVHTFVHLDRAALCAEGRPCAGDLLQQASQRKTTNWVLLPSVSRLALSR